MYVVVRFLFGLLVGALVFRVQKKTGHGNRCVSVLTAVFAVFVTITLSCLVPIENAWKTFDSPESVCTYKYGAKPELVIEGDETALFVVNGSTSMAIRDHDGWKIGQEWKLKQSETLMQPGVIAYMQQYDGFADGYVVIVCLRDEFGERIEIHDGHDTLFHVEEDGDSCVFQGYIGRFVGDYSFTINDVDYVIDSRQSDG